MMAAVVALSILAASCSDDSPKEEQEPVEEEKAPRLVEASLTLDPTQGETIYKLVAASDWSVPDWTIYSDDGPNWVSVTPMSGQGDQELTIAYDANETGKARSTTFYVKVGKYDAVEIFLSQSKLESNVNESDLEFLKAVVDGNMLVWYDDSNNPQYPKVESWFNVDPGQFPGVGMEEKDGKLFITTFDGAPFVDFPERMNLPELSFINMRGQNLNGKRLPKEWNTPKLTYVNLSVCGLVGPIPEGFASTTPLLNQIYMDQNHLWGALPHVWASKVLEVALFANQNNCSRWKKDADGNILIDANGNKIEKEYPYTTGLDNEGLGYLVPAGLDVILNQSRQAQSDRTQMKLGGALMGNFEGFEEGWGQARYERYDPGAKTGDVAVWSDYRLLAGRDLSGDELDTWAWYFSNMGYPGEDWAITVPHKMVKWNQTDADAYTAACEAKYGSN